MIKLELVNPRTWKDGDILTIEVLEVIEEGSGVWKIKVREVKEAPRERITDPFEKATSIRRDIDARTLTNTGR